MGVGTLKVTLFVVPELDADDIVEESITWVELILEVVDAIVVATSVTI